MANPARRFPPPWSVEDIVAAFKVCDSARPIEQHAEKYDADHDERTLRSHLIAG